MLIAGNRDDASYMLRTLKEYFEEFGIMLNTRITEYMKVCSDDKSDLEIGSGQTIKHSDSFKYLGVTLTPNGKSSNKIAQGKMKETVKSKQLKWYGPLQRMEEIRWPKKIWNGTPAERRKRARPPGTWKMETEEAIQSRNLEEGDWWNRNF
ncbi:hypothetical protein HHI36_011994 [Cryptolaemus montrouzieri]|uniref:Reverse transcriptase domain-containing protein n=1 Tax=Cryptolaemus montrouzieri TaxID=559131 RepID=A0ABD2ND76_9CUCU